VEFGVGKHNVQIMLFVCRGIRLELVDELWMINHLEELVEKHGIDGHFM
jgi:hypothetical protein